MAHLRTRKFVPFPAFDFSSVSTPSFLSSSVLFFLSFSCQRLFSSRCAWVVFILRAKVYPRNYFSEHKDSISSMGFSSGMHKSVTIYIHMGDMFCFRLIKQVLWTLSSRERERDQFRFWASSNSAASSYLHNFTWVADTVETLCAAHSGSVSLPKPTNLLLTTSIAINTKLIPRIPSMCSIRFWIHI